MWLVNKLFETKLFARELYFFFSLVFFFFLGRGGGFFDFCEKFCWSYIFKQVLYIVSSSKQTHVRPKKDNLARCLLLCFYSILLRSFMLKEPKFMD